MQIRLLRQWLDKPVGSVIDVPECTGRWLVRRNIGARENSPPPAKRRTKTPEAAAESTAPENQAKPKARRMAAVSK